MAIRSRRMIVLVLALILASGSAFLTWWMTTLSGLPDVGDPFDIAGFADPPVADAENAFTLYREASAKLSAEPEEMTGYDWATAGPTEKGWLERNREALELWRRGTERSRSLDIPPRSMTIMTPLPTIQNSREFSRLAQLEAGRLAADGDLEGAWRWHRASFRASRHLGVRAPVISRVVGMAIHKNACREMTLWASDPRVTPAMLRRAIDSAIADYAGSAPVSDGVKVEYLGFLKTYEDPDLVWKCLTDENLGVTGKPDWVCRDRNLFAMARSFRKEPERSRRIIRLIYANVLTACDLPPDRRPPVASTLPDLTNRTGTPATLVDLYQTTESAPAAARALEPAQIREWYRTSLYAAHLSPSLTMFIKLMDAERGTQANLLIALANRLFEIEHGQPPKTVEELVGPYLKTLPDGCKPIESFDPRRTFP